MSFELEGLGRGTASLSSSVTARDGARTRSDGPTPRSLEVAAPALFLQLEADPGPATASEPFELRAILTNTGDTELTGIEVRGEATSEDAGNVRVSAPSPSTVASLAPGARATVTYQVTSGPGRVRFEATATGTDGATGTVTSNTDWLDKEVSGAVLTGAVGERSGIARGSAKGGELVTLTGRGLSEFTHVDIERADGELVASVPVASAADRELTFISPSTVAWLEEAEDGALELGVDLTAWVDDPEAPDGRVSTSAIGFEFGGPAIDAVTNQRTGDPFGSALVPSMTLVVEGRSMSDVEGVALLVAGTTQLIEVVEDITVLDDTTITFAAPSVAHLLEPAEDGASTLEVDVYASWADDEGPDGLVRSNPGGFEFRGPSITRISFDRSRLNRASILGDEVLDIFGEGFGASEDGSERPVRVSFKDDRTGGESIVSASVLDDHLIRVPSTPDWLSDFPGVVGPDGAWRLEGSVRVVIEPESEDDAELLVSNPAPFEVLGPRLDEAVGRRTEAATAAVNGNDDITLRGFALEVVDRVNVYRRGSDELLVTLPVENAAEDPFDLTFEAPELTRFLAVESDGSASLDTDIEAAVEVGGRTVTSPRVPMMFVGPTLTDVVTELDRDAAAAAAGRISLELTGELLADVTEVHVLRAGSGELLEVLDVERYIGDGGLVVTAPRMARHLRAVPGGASSAEVTLRAVYSAPAAPEGRVTSNGASFEFKGPQLDSIGSSRSEPGRSPVVGGDEWVLDGDWLDGVDRIWLYRRGDASSLVWSEELDNRLPDGLRYATRSLAAELGASEEQLELDVVVGYLDDRAPGGMVVSNALPWTLETPIITALGVVGTPSADRVELLLEGRFFEDAQWVGYGARDGSAVLLPAPTRSDTSMQVVLDDVWENVTELGDGRVGARFEIFLAIDDARRPDGLLTSNTVIVEIEAGAVATTVTERARAGDRRVEVASNDGWGGGDYARLLTPEGDVVRRVDRVGSLVFDAPLPVDVPAGTIVVKVDPPQGDSTPPTVTSSAGSVPLGAEMSIEFDCDDGDGVGVEGCVGSVPSGTELDTSLPGTRTVTVETWDRNGNAATATLVYVVGDAPSPPTTAPPTPTTTPTSPPTSPPPEGPVAGPVGPPPAEQVLGATATPAGSGSTRAGSSLALTGGDPGSAPVLALGLVVLGLLFVGLGRRRG